MNSAWRSTKIADAHDTASFDCGIPELNYWLATQALRAQAAGTAVTRVWLPPDSDRVFAYNSLAPTEVSSDRLTRSQAGGHSTIPAYLIAKLALDTKIHGQGFGTSLLLDAMESVVRAAHMGGGRLVVVDAINEPTASFYTHHGFHSVKGDSLRLVMKVATAVRALSTASVDISRDTEIGLMSVEMHKPDGTTSACVLNRAEADTLSIRLAELAAAKEANPAVNIDLRAELANVLGRDLLAE